jgi:hypothetical protein
MTEACENCRYWLAHAETDPPTARPRYGSCRRQPPVPTTGTALHCVTAWPQTQHAEWCGEWAEKVEPKPKPCTHQWHSNARTGRFTCRRCGLELAGAAAETLKRAPDFRNS